MRESLDHQGLPRIEMRVEPAMSKAGVLHEVGNANAMRALLAKPHRGFPHDPRVGFELVFPGVSHGGPIICSKSYNDIRHLITPANAKSCTLFHFIGPRCCDVDVTGRTLTRPGFAGEVTRSAPFPPPLRERPCTWSIPIAVS